MKENCKALVLFGVLLSIFSLNILSKKRTRKSKGPLEQFKSTPDQKKPDPKYIAYPGEKFTLEWYFTDKGKSGAKDYFEGLDEKEQEKLKEFFKELGDEGKLDKGKFRHEGDKIYAFKKNKARLLCFSFIGSKIIITNGYNKDGDKMPQKILHRVRIAKGDYEERCKNGTYYK